MRSMRPSKYAQAEALYTQTLEIQRRVLGADNPDTLAVGGLLAISLSYEKQFSRAKVLIEEIVQKARLSGDLAALTSVWYNAACAEAVAGHTKAAMEYLQKAIDLGYADIVNMTTDKDLKSLRKNPQFIALLADVKERAAPPQPGK